MKPNFLVGDGTGRPIRPGQEVVLRWLQDNWEEADVFGVCSPTGSGKSFIARAIQRATGANIIVPNNVLLDQYKHDYPEMNSLKGGEHYRCKTTGKSCATTMASKKFSCTDCPFKKAKESAKGGFPTVFNPMSLWYLKLQPGYSERSVTILDECHLIESLLMSFTDKTFNGKRLGLPANANHATVFSEWLTNHHAKIADRSETYKNTGDLLKSSRYEKQANALKVLLDDFLDNPETYAIWWESKKNYKTLHVKPTYVSKHILSKLVGDGKLILLSGTVLESDMKFLSGGRTYKYLEMPSPIPVQNRQVFYRPLSFPLTYGQFEYKDLAQELDKICISNPDKNIFIHVTYGAQIELAKHMITPVITHTKQDKIQKLNEFKKRGGVMLASGMAEGVDLKGNMCHINIIPKLQYAYLGDPWITKRKSLPDGIRWYSLQTLKWLIQAAGRSTRSETDYSEIYILDQAFSNLMMHSRKHVPKYFMESIKWQSSIKKL